MYASSDDMIESFGEREARTLSDRELAGSVDADVLGKGLAKATDEINGYIAGRYKLPLPQTPPILKGICCDIARYRLTGTERTCSDEIRDRYRDAIRYLEKVANGTVTLGVFADTGAAVPSAGSSVAFCSGSKNWSRRSTQGGGY
jgi:phage gp36-like protein